jgi:hypothetical protein
MGPEIKNGYASSKLLLCSVRSLLIRNAVTRVCVLTDWQNDANGPLGFARLQSRDKAKSQTGLYSIWSIFEAAL